MSEKKKPLDEVWAAAFDHPGEKFLVGREVLCDLCDVDWTDRPEPGGFLFLSKAVCPDCTPKFMADVARFNERKHIRGTCPADESFADFVRRMRGPDAFIRVTVARPAACQGCGATQEYGRIRCTSCGKPLVFPK